jgi:hypothetical protein
MLRTAPYAVTSGAQTMQVTGYDDTAIELIATTDPAMIGMIAGMVRSLGE